MTKPNYYAVIPANVRYHKDLTDKAKLLYAEITCLCNFRGNCWATNEYFAKLYDTSTVTISRNIKDLEKHKLIRIKYLYNGNVISKRVIAIIKNVNGEALAVNKNDNGAVIKNVKENIKITTSTINNKNKTCADAFEVAKSIWNESTFTKVSDRSNGFKKKVFVRMKTQGFDLKKILEIANKSKLIQEKGTWFTFDWIFKNDTNWRKVLDGNYNDKDAKTNKPYHSPYAFDMAKALKEKENKI